MEAFNKTLNKSVLMSCYLNKHKYSITKLSKGLFTQCGCLIFITGLERRAMCEFDILPLRSGLCLRSVTVQTTRRNTSGVPANPNKMCNNNGGQLSDTY